MTGPLPDEMSVLLRLRTFCAVSNPGLTYTIPGVLGKLPALRRNTVDAELRPLLLEDGVSAGALGVDHIG